MSVHINDQWALSDLGDTAPAVDDLFAQYARGVSGTDLRTALQLFLGAAKGAPQDIIWPVLYEINQRKELQSDAQVPKWLLEQISNRVKSLVAGIPAGGEVARQLTEGSMTTQIGLVNYDEELMPYGDRPWYLGELADLTSANAAVDALFAAYKKASISGTSLRDNLAQFLVVAANANPEVKYRFEYEIGTKADGSKRGELQSSAAVPEWLIDQLAGLVKNLAAISSEGVEMIVKELQKRVPQLLSAPKAAPAASIAAPKPAPSAAAGAMTAPTRDYAPGPTKSEGFPWEWVAGIGAAGVVLALLLWPTEGNIRRAPAPAPTMQGLRFKRRRRHATKRRARKASGCGCGL